MAAVVINEVLSTSGLVVVSTLVAMLFIRYYRIRGSVQLPLPPGPKKLPLLGNSLVHHDFSFDRYYVHTHPISRICHLLSTGLHSLNGRSNMVRFMPQFYK